MKGLMSDLFNNKPMTTGHSSMYKKPLSVGEFKRTPKARDLGLLPGDTILKLVSPKIISFSEFAFHTLASRIKWEKHQKYLNARYGMSLEALTKTCKSLTYSPLKKIFKTEFC